MSDISAGSQNDQAGSDEQYLSIEECQQVELGIMKELHRYCVERGIAYAMAYGTLLGAVRHRGFIPWDNDMDIVMPRPDYECFLQEVRSNPIADNLYLLHYTTDPRYHYQCARICDSRTSVAPPYIREQPKRMGVWIDVFPIDGIWDSSILHLPSVVQMRLYKTLQRADIYALSEARGWKHSVKRLINALFPNRGNYYQRKVDEIGMRCPYALSKRAGNMTEFEYAGDYYSAKDLENAVLLPFEDTAFFAPRNWDSLLRMSYGDYMQLPPEDARIEHDLRATWIKGAL